MTRAVQLPQTLRPLTPDDRLRYIPYAFQHTSATHGWNGFRVEYNTRQPAGDFVHPSLACLMVVLTGKIISERTDHRCDNEGFELEALVEVTAGLQQAHGP